MTHSESSPETPGRAFRRTAVRIVAGSVAIAATLSVAACGNSGSGAKAQAAQTTPAAQAAQTTPAAQAAKVDNISLIGKTDAGSSVEGASTGKDGWAAFAPSTLNVGSGDTVVLTIKEYDSAATALPDSSPYNAVQGGTETVDGTPVTTVGNDQIAHTITIPELGINIPLPKAPDKGFTTVVFTFKAGAAGTYTFKCMTPCGDGSDGMGGAMQTDGWMQGKLIVA